MEVCELFCLSPLEFREVDRCFQSVLQITSDPRFFLNCMSCVVFVPRPAATCQSMSVEHGRANAKEYEQTDPYAQPNRFSHELSSDMVGMFLKEVEGPDLFWQGWRSSTCCRCMHGSDTSMGSISIVVMFTWTYGREEYEGVGRLVQTLNALIKFEKTKVRTARKLEAALTRVHVHSCGGKDLNDAGNGKFGWIWTSATAFSNRCTLLESNTLGSVTLVRNSQWNHLHNYIIIRYSASGILHWY